MSFDAVSLWLAQHPDWILGAIFAISVMESLALVGLLSPGIALLFVAGTAAGGAQISYWAVLTAAYVGAVAGDLFSYFLGYHFHQRIVTMPPFRQHPEWLNQAEKFFLRYGLYGLFVGRFIGPLRPVLPMIAGALELPFLRFLVLDLCSGPFWAAAYLTPGFLVGSATGAAAGQAQQLGLFLAGLLGVSIVCAELLSRFLTRERSPSQANRAALATLLLAGLFLVTLYFIVLTQTADPINRWLALEAARLRRPEADMFFVALTGMGDHWPMIIWGLSIGAALLLMRAWWPAGVWLFGTLAGNFLMQIMKSTLGIERPHLSHQVPNGYSFPSGHASMGLVFTGLLTLLLWPQLSARARRVTLHLAALYTVLITASRLYLGVHWSSDLLAGWALGTAVIALSWLCLQNPPAALESSVKRTRPFAMIVAVSLVWLGLCGQMLPSLDTALKAYAPELQESLAP